MDLDKFKRMAQAIHDDQSRKAEEGSAVVADAAERAKVLLDMWADRGDYRFCLQDGHYPVLPDAMGYEGPQPKYATYQIRDREIQNEDGIPVDASVDIAARFIKHSEALMGAIARRIGELQRSGGL